MSLIRIPGRCRLMIRRTTRETIHNRARRTGRLLVVLLSLFLFTHSLTVLAQSPVTDLDQLTVDIWPDYDRPQVLVLITGSLQPDTPLPATITIPYPSGADLNAVARIGEDGGMFSDIEYDDSVPGQLTFTTPDPKFRIEYYMPYSANGNDRSFNFNWQSELAIDNFLTSVQQPSMANEMTLSPEAGSVSTGAEGLRYHEIPASSLAPGEVYDLAVGYTLIRPQLSAEILSPQEVPLIGSDGAGSSTDGGDDNFNLLVVAGAAAFIIIIVVIGWFVLRAQSSSRRVSKPRPVRKNAPATKTASSSTRFCHECGQPVDAGDRFCSNCGAAQKGS